MCACRVTRSINFTRLSASEAARKIRQIEVSAERRKRSLPSSFRKFSSDLHFMGKVGLGYLALGRSAKTLSGGESQRIRLAAQLGSNLRGVLYVLDEPTIGLHPRDNLRLLDTLTALREKGNSLVIVEHDEETMRRADHIVDLGPRAGIHGGEVVATGTLRDIEQTCRFRDRPLPENTALLIRSAENASVVAATLSIGSRFAARSANNLKERRCSLSRSDGFR